MSAVVGQPAAAEAKLAARLPEGAVRDLLLLAVLWATSLLVVNPAGNFPLNDDWSFGLAVKRLLQTGGFRPTGFTSMPLITQTIWGTLFCLPAGFSFNALRCSTLVMSLGGMLSLYLLVRQVHSSRRLAALAALTLGFNPIYYALSNTFMTDAFFTALAVMAALCFSRNLESGSDAALLCGLGFALAATLCRQLGISVPLAFAIALLCRRGFAGRWLIRACAPAVVCAGALFAFQHWMRVTGRLPALYSLQSEELLSTLGAPARLVSGLAKHVGTALLYLGWFSLPVIALVLPRVNALRKKGRACLAAAGAGAAFLFGAAVTLVLTRGPMPTAGNIVLAQGIGPLTLRDVHILALPHVPTVWRGYWYAVTAMALAGGALLVGAGAWLAANRRATVWGMTRSIARVRGMFFLLCGAAYLGPILVIGGWDRYYLPALPFLLAGAAALATRESSAPPGGRLVISMLLLVALALFSVAGTRDYLAWNRARWQALDDLLAGGNVTASEVDGGFEFNGYYLYDPAYRAQPGRSWYWVKQDSFLLAYAEMPGWITLKEYPYAHYLPPYHGRVFVLRKAAPEDR